MGATASDEVQAPAAAARKRARALPGAFASGRPLREQELIEAPVRWPRPSRLRAPLAVAPGRMAEGLQALGLGTVGALLEHLPSDSREARTVAALRAGE